MRCEAVAQHVWGKALGDACNITGIPAHAANAGRMDMLILTEGWEEPRLRTLNLPVLAQNEEHTMTQNAVAIMTAFAILDTHQHATAIDITDL